LRAVRMASSVWEGMVCPDCGCRRLVACDTRRIADGSMLRVRQCQNPKCRRRVHTIERIHLKTTKKYADRRVRKPGSPARPG